MAVIQLRENPLHRCLAEDGRTFLDPETVTVLLDGSHLLVVQVDDLSMNAPERCAVHLYIVCG